MPEVPILKFEKRQIIVYFEGAEPWPLRLNSGVHAWMYLRRNYFDDIAHCEHVTKEHIGAYERELVHQHQRLTRAEDALDESAHEHADRVSEITALDGRLHSLNTALRMERAKVDYEREIKQKAKGRILELEHARAQVQDEHAKQCHILREASVGLGDANAIAAYDKVYSHLMNKRIEYVRSGKVDDAVALQPVIDWLGDECRRMADAATKRTAQASGIPGREQGVVPLLRRADPAGQGPEAAHA